MSIYDDLAEVEEFVKGTEVEDAFDRYSNKFADLERTIMKLERVKVIIENIRDLHLDEIREIML